MKRAAPVVLLVLAVALAIFFWSRAETPTVETSSERRPNVLLITIDTLRADRIGRGLTPAIDGLAARGITFSNVRATAPLTLPSHVSLMTGVIPPLHGVRENGVVFDRKTPTLARLFKDAGYRTSAFIGAYVLNRRFGLDEGFETYDDAVRRDVERAEQLEAERPGAEVIDAALKWLPVDDSRTDIAPFFAWVHMYDPHAPYAPPAEYLAKAGGNAYDGEVAYADAQVGRLLDALAERGLAANTIVVVTGDHGESLGEHGEQTHGMLVYDATLRVPLVVSGPSYRADDAAVPRTDDRPRSLTEVTPALLQLAGLRVPPGLCGQLLAPPGESATTSAVDCDSYSESVYPRQAGWHALSALSEAQWKLVLSSEAELYDLQKDPAEQNNIAAAHPGVVQAMSVAVRNLAPSGGRTAAVAPEAAERLRALGYVSGSNAVTADDPNAPNPAGEIAAWTRFEEALGRLQRGDTSGALALLKPLAVRHSSAPVFQSSYAQALKDAGDAAGAVRVYKAAVQKWPTNAALFHDLAVAAKEAGDIAEATRAEQAALALDSTSAMAHNGLGLLHADAGRSADAAVAFERAAEQDPTNPSYWTNLGNARAALGDAAAAERAYRRALEMDAEFADALNGLGTLFVQGKRAAAAVPLFERALRRDPQLYEARLNLGIAYQESGQLEKAAAAYREVLAKAPPSATREREAAKALLGSLR
ncbi:MAG: sulfatase-like hydrolase/transferase [Acidobacteriota bacterium]|nr:sulfatase-like hydrolase/transferase [Acidobacteriota bacterium]